MTHYRWLTPWTSCPSGGRLLAPVTETTPLAPSTAEAAAATERLAAWAISALTAIAIGGVALVIYVPHGGHAGGSSWLPEINASLNATATILPARPAKPRDKAIAEVGVQVAERWIVARLRHETFYTLAALNERIAELLAALNARRWT